ncbi:MAG: NAD-glutamate dehydrogenase [Gordonia sp. (in: high G+C Gram-positive bacteria)]
MDDHDGYARVRRHLDVAFIRTAGRSMVEVVNTDAVGADIVVVTDDMPLLVEAVLAAVEARDLSIGRIDHPVLAVTRDAAGRLTGVSRGRDGDMESWIYVTALAGRGGIDAAGLRAELIEVIDRVRDVDTDVVAMRGQLSSCAADCAVTPVTAESGISATESYQYARLLDWFAGSRFVPLGYARASGGGELTGQLGVWRGATVRARFTPITDVPLLPRISRVYLKTGVQRSNYPILIQIPAFDESGVYVGEHRFLGMFTSSGLHQTILDIPVLGSKVHEVLRRAGVDPDSFAGESMIELLQNYPLVEMFAIDSSELGRRVQELLDAVATRSLRVFLQVNPQGQTATALIYLPRDRYNTNSRLALQETVRHRLHGSALEYSARVSEMPLALLRVTVRVEATAAASLGSFDTGTAAVADMRQALAESIRSWDDRVRESALATTSSTVIAHGGIDALLRLIPSLPDDYKDQRAPAAAVTDLIRVVDLAAGELSVALDRRVGSRSRDESELAARQALWDFTLYLCGESATLTDVLPVVHSLGLDVVDEHPYRLVRSDGSICHVYEFGVTLADQMTVDTGGDEDLEERFTEAFLQIWRRNAEIDAYNELIIRCGLRWREAAMLRAYGAYLRQCGFAYSPAHIARTLGHHRAVTRGLVDVFEASFDPGRADVRRREQLLAALGEEVARVLGLDADRIVSAFTAAVIATVRTNFYVPADAKGSDPDAPDATHRPVMAFKLRPRDIPQTPQPRPEYEIFVYSPRIEGVHLRFGAVARGGLRWSDRREDFRTEILGLVKAQAVKNAVIVPVGAKGGFVVKRPPAATGDAGADRAAQRAEVLDCYRQFISGLLDVTDNLDRSTGAVIAADSVIRRDGDDPYLVVAADKGTATFSDIANAVAARYGFWLGDAFASGGSAGYDHKAMGITARGAWESVKRHFREMGVDTASHDFTVVGIGDMSGDVFGNGMLLSEHIRLVAAFDHRHIFVDPQPVAATSFAQRKRLFALPRSSWADYDTSVISAGGGVWSRELKSIPVSAQMRQALGIDADIVALSPPELIRAILLAPVDLLWNGGIGTYVKASTESDADVGDKANDAIRVNGNQLRAKVFGEGGNLGATERGRIEFDLAGGRVNTDAMDNSAGVDCSDHEVNIKIALDAAVSAGTLEHSERDGLLESMTGEVAELVLADNISQNAELGFSRTFALDRVDVHARLLHELAERGVDLRLEALPTPQQLLSRARAEIPRVLTSPELATLMAHVKLIAKADLLASDLPDNDVFADRLVGYFPAPLRQRFAGEIHGHRLRREIVATVLVNDVIDGAGLTHLFRLREATGATTTEAVRAFVVAERVFGMSDLFTRILHAPAPVAVVDSMMFYARRLLFRASRWFLAFRPQPLAIAAEITRYTDRIAELSTVFDGWFGASSAADVDQRVAHYESAGVATDLARTVAVSLHRFCLLDIIDAAEIADRDPVEVGELYFAVMENFGLEDLLTAVSRLDSGDRWHALARLALRDDIHGALRAVTLKILESSEPDESTADKITEWEASYSSRLGRVRAVLTDIEHTANLDLATLSVAARQLRSVIR